MTKTNTQREKVRKDHPDSWIAVDEGDFIHGKVLDVTEAWSDQRQGGSFYPLLTIFADQATGYDTERVTPVNGQGIELKVHCFGAVLYNEVMKHKPEVSETLTITYKGTGAAKKAGYNPPEIYSLRVEGRTDQAQRAYARIEGTPTPEATPSPDVEINTDGLQEDIPF